MNGFYSLWTAPYFNSRGGAGDFALQDFDLLTLLLSTVMYEKHNGATRMYADAAAEAYLRGIGVEALFSRGIVRMRVQEEIDPQVYWAAGKLEALRLEEQPSVMIDTDLIIWSGIEERLRQLSVAVIHREELNPEIYPPPETFAMRGDYRFPRAWDFSVLPANTALLYLRDTHFKEYYVEEAFRFMTHSAPTQDNLCHMVFAEQRILPMCAAAKGLTVTAFCDRLEQLREQSVFTHVWGHKNVLKYNMDERRAYCRRAMARLKQEAPEAYAIAARIGDLAEYRI